MKTKFSKFSFKLFPMVLMVLGASFVSRAAVLSFGFSGTILSAYNPSNALPSTITPGTPFTGVLTYDTSEVYLGQDADPDPAVGDYYFRTNGFWLQVEIAGHTFASIKPNPADQPAVVIIHNYDVDDTFWADASPQGIRMDGAPLPGTYDSCGLGFTLFDNSGTANTNDFLPTTAPQLAAYPSARRLELRAINSQGWTFNVVGTVTNIATNYAPALTIRKGAGNNVVLAWPLAANGFALESRTNLAGGNWQPVAAPVIDVVTEHTVTVPATATKCFYRLSK